MVPKWIVVTGASSGIGRATSRYLLQEGYQVILSSRREEMLWETVNGFPFSPRDFRVLPWDFSKLDLLHAFARRVKEEVGEISGLVHCAGLQKTIPLSMSSVPRLMEVFSLNTFAAILLVDLFSQKGFFLPGCSFVLLSSLAARRASEGQSLYAASKGALESFALSASLELAKKGIRINTVVPGLLETPMVVGFLEKLSEVQRERLLHSYSLGIGQPEDIAPLIEFLISSRSKWITGRNYPIDGGFQ